MTETTTQSSTTHRKETPWARLVLSVDAPREEWLAARRHGITATDLPAILGLSRYKTAVDVWTDKLMSTPSDNEAGEAAFWGTRLEEPVAQAWAEKHGVKIRRVGLVANDELPWMLASLDRLVTGCPDGRCALEVKTRSLFVGEEWEKALPADVEAQVSWQLAVTGLDHVHVAALIGGQRLVEHRVDRDPSRNTELLRAATIVWNAVQANEMPNLPPKYWTDAFLTQANPKRTGEKEVDNVARAALGDYVKVCDELKTLEDQKATLRTLLVGLLGDAEIATFEGRTLYTYKASTTRRLDAKALAAIYPQAADDERCYTTSETRTFRVSPKKEKP